MIVRADRGRPPGTTVGLIGTVLVHAGAAAFAFTQVKPAKAGPPSYAVELVAAPAADPQAAAGARGRADAAAGGEAGAGQAAAQAQAGQTGPAPPTPKPPPTETKREPPPKTAAPVTPAPGETPSTGHRRRHDQDAGPPVSLSGVPPEHRDPGLPQLGPRVGPAEQLRRDQLPDSRDGTVRDIRFVTRSGSFSFDLGAQGAIEAAGNARSFGPLPDGWDADVLPVSFYFKPISR